MKSNLTIFCVVLLTFASLFYGCEDDKKDRFDPPKGYLGANIETLEKKGNYTIFLALLEKAQFKLAVERQLYTLFVPHDTSFRAYFKKIGKNSVDDFITEEAVELVGQHMISMGRSRDQLIYELNWSELQDSTKEYASLFYRKVTYGKPNSYMEYNIPYDAGLTKGQNVEVRRTETWVPLMSREYFRDMFGQEEFDYEYMFQGSQWKNPGFGFTAWGEGVVTEIGLTQSGFIYYIDKVVAPMPTMNKYLYDHPNEFSLFYNIAQKFATYSDPQERSDQSGFTYLKKYTDISNFADETGGGGTGKEGRQLNQLTMFAPYNQVLQTYLDNTLYNNNGYAPGDTAPKLFYQYLIQSQLHTRLQLPSIIDRRYVNHYGDSIDIDLDVDIDKAGVKFCSNGILYPSNKFFEPNAFTCATGPVFFSKDHTIFLYTLDIAKVIKSVNNPSKKITLFASNNTELLAYGIRSVEDDNGKVTIEVQKPDGQWMAMIDEELKKYVNDCYALGVYEDFDGEGYIRLASNNYLYYNNGQIYSGGNQYSGDVNTVTRKVGNLKNGNLFFIDNTIKRPPTAATIMNPIDRNADPDLSEFYKLLDKAKLISNKKNPNNEMTKDVIYYVNIMPNSTQWTVLAPTNQAIADARLAGLIPENAAGDTLKNFLRYFFIQDHAIFDDGQFSGTVETSCIDTVIDSKTIYNKLTFTNGVHALSVVDEAGQVVNINHSDAGRLVEGGVLHKINTVLLTKMP